MGRFTSSANVGSGIVVSPAPPNGLALSCAARHRRGPGPKRGLPEGYTGLMARWKPRQLQRRVGQRCKASAGGAQRGARSVKPRPSATHNLAPGIAQTPRCGCRPGDGTPCAGARTAAVAQNRECQRSRRGLPGSSHAPKGGATGPGRNGPDPLEGVRAPKTDPSAMPAERDAVTRPTLLDDRDLRCPRRWHQRAGREAVQRMAAKLRPRVMLPRYVSSSAAHMAEARGRQLQRLVGRQASIAT